MKILLFTVFAFLLLTSCSVVKKIAGADFDALQFAKAREAKMFETRFMSASALSSRLAKQQALDASDINFYLSQNLLTRIVKQYDSASGWLDDATSYIIYKSNLSLKNGSAIVSLDLSAHNAKYNVDVDLVLDCIMTLEMTNNELFIKLEPFNISPAVTAAGLLSSTEEIIQNLIKINLANINKNFPPMKIPLEFANAMNVEKSKTVIKDKINMLIISPQRKINYMLKLKEILIFEGSVYVAMNVENLEVK